MTFKTDEELGFVKRQETESQITDTDGEEASLDANLESFDELGNDRFDARLQNSDITDAAEDALADFLQEQIANSSGKGSISSIVIEGLDAQAADWIEIEGDIIEIDGNIIDLKDIKDLRDVSDGGYVVIID